MKKIIKYHLNTYKKCMLDQNLEGVAQKMRLPRPSEAQNWKGHGRLNFWATALKFCTSTYFSKIFKWYLHDIFIFPLVSDFEKMQKSDMSRLQWSLDHTNSCKGQTFFNSGRWQIPWCHALLCCFIKKIDVLAFQWCIICSSILLWTRPIKSGAKKSDTSQNWPLVKNSQFLYNLHENWSKLLSQELIILTKFY